MNLQQSRTINAAATFNNLQVFGPIKVKNTYNGVDLDQLLENALYIDSPNVVVNSYKNIALGTFDEGIHIESEIVNDFYIKDVATKSVEQNLALSHLHGDVIFQKLETSGLFDGINITEVTLDSIKLFGDQYTQAELVFEQVFMLSEIEANHFYVEKYLNNIEVNNLIKIDENTHIQSEVNFNELFVDQCDIYGNFHVPEIVNNIQLKDFAHQHLSISRPQYVSTPMKAHTVTMVGNLRNEYVNSVETSSFTNSVLKSQSARNLLFTGDILIDNMFIEGNAGIKLVNGFDLNGIIENAIWLNRPLSWYESVIFVNSIRVIQNITLNGKMNDDFVNDLNEIAVRGKNYLNGAKVYQNGFYVKGKIDTNLLNDEPLTDLLYKNSETTFNGPLTIQGHIFTNTVNAYGLINNVSIQYLKDIYYFDYDNEQHVIKSDISFQNYVQVKTLVALNSFNDIPNINYFLDSVLRADRDYNITIAKTFISTTYFESGFFVKSFNYENLSNLLSNIVVLNQEPKYVNGPIKFNEPVYASKLIVTNDLATHNIADCSPLEWYYNGIMINKDEDITCKYL